jgi:hypothetical protein
MKVRTSGIHPSGPVSRRPVFILGVCLFGIGIGLAVARLTLEAFRR